MDRSILLTLGLLVLGGLLVVAGMTDPLALDVTHAFAGPGAAHWLGTDDLGRDVLVRLLAGVRVSLLVSAVVLVETAVIGIPLGLAAGWFGGWADTLISKLAEVVLSFPGILLALALAALVGPGIGNVMVALGVLGWVGFFRLTRVQVRVLRGLPFVNAATLAGVKLPQVWWRHVLPNCAAALLVEALLIAAGTMVAEAGLSFLGLGIPAPQPSLGGMLRDGMRDLLVAPWLVIAPGVVLIGLTVGLNVIAEGLRRYTDNGRNPT